MIADRREHASSPLADVAQELIQQRVRACWWERDEGDPDRYAPGPWYLDGLDDARTGRRDLYVTVPWDRLDRILDVEALGGLHGDVELPPAGDYSGSRTGDAPWRLIDWSADDLGLRLTVRLAEVCDE